MDPHDGGGAVEPCQGARLVKETLAAPGELLGMIGRARHDGGAPLAQGERGRQIFLDGDVAMERGVACPIGDAEGALAEDGFQLVATQRRACRQHAAHVGPRLSAASLDIGHHALLPPKHD